jgi:hypothetical protein
MLAAVRADVIELNNASVEEYSQPCYNKATTNVVEYKGITTWCDIVRDGHAMSVTCTSVTEPEYCTE